MGGPAMTGMLAEAFKHSARSSLSVKSCSTTGPSVSRQLATTCNARVQCQIVHLLVMYCVLTVALGW